MDTIWDEQQMLHSQVQALLFALFRAFIAQIINITDSLCFLALMSNSGDGKTVDATQ
jgi:hypothetical protein